MGLQNASPTAPEGPRGRACAEVEAPGTEQWLLCAGWVPFPGLPSFSFPWEQKAHGSGRRGRLIT